MTTDQDFLPKAPTITEQAKAAQPLPAGWRAIPGSIWALGFVSMFADISSEMIHSLLPMFLVSVLGASALAVGLIEGLAESTALRSGVYTWASLRDCLQPWWPTPHPPTCAAQPMASSTSLAASPCCWPASLRVSCGTD